MIHIKMKIKKKRKKSRIQRKSNINKRKRNLQKIEPKNLLEPLIVNIFNLKKNKEGCRAKQNASI